MNKSQAESSLDSSLLAISGYWAYVEYADIKANSKHFLLDGIPEIYHTLDGKTILVCHCDENGEIDAGILSLELFDKVACCFPAKAHSNPKNKGIEILMDDTDEKVVLLKVENKLYFIAASKIDGNRKIHQGITSYHESKRNKGV